MKVALIVVASILACALPDRASAQAYAPTRDGFTGALGVGWGEGKFTCSACHSELHHDLTGFARAGYTLNPNFIIAAHGSYWQHSEDRATSTFWFLLATTQLYPYTPAGWYLEAGLGYGDVRLKDDITNDDVQAGSLSFMLGTGYDFRIWDNFSLTPFANWLTTNGGEAHVNGSGTTESIGGNLVQLGIAFTWH